MKITLDDIEVDLPPGLYALVRFDNAPILNIPEPTPDPEPDPTPETEPPTGKPADLTKAVNQARLINVDQWNWATNPYTRGVPLVVWTKDTVDLKVKLQSLTTAGGGKTFAFSGADYRVTLSGVEVGSFPGGSGVVTVPLDLTQVPDGWHILDVSEYGDETSVPLPVYVLRNGVVGQQDWVPVFTSSHEIKDVYHIKWVPAKHEPLTWPLGIYADEYLPFNSTTPRSELTTDLLTGTITSNPRILVQHSTGVLGASTKQRYFWDDMLAKHPDIEFLDGPRGANSLALVTHLEIGVATFGNDPDSPPVGNVYFCTPVSFGKIRASGEVVTLAGLRHKGIPNYYGSPSNAELIGDWSSIDPSRRGFNLLWGMTWVQSSLETDLTADPIPTEANLRPHKTAPIALVADSKHDAIRSITFDSHRHGAVPVIREWYYPGDGVDCWDIASWRGKYPVSERGRHRIVLLNDNAEVERVLVEGEDLAGIDRYHIAQRRRDVTLDAVQQQQVVAPEGLAVHGDWLYYGSAVMRQVKRVHLIDGRVEKFCDIPGDKRFFAKIAVDPEGGVYVTTWDVSMPYYFKPDGTPGQLPWGAQVSYSTAAAASHNRIVYATVLQGVAQIRRKLPTDKPRPPLFNAGHDEWVSKGYYLSHGVSGESVFGLPLPWGESAAMDDYLKGLGHG